MPDGWMDTTIGEIAEVVAGSTPKTKEPSYWGGGIPWIVPSEVTRQEGRRITSTDRTITEAGLASIRSPLLPVNTVLLTSRATVGAVALAGVPMAINQGFAALVAGPRVLPKYLMYWCQSNRATFESLAGGSTFPEINRQAVRSIPMVLPPISEQRRIVDLVEQVDLVSESARLQMAAASGTMRSVREALIAKYPAPLRPLGDVLHDIDGGVSPRAEDRPPRDGEAAVLKISAVWPGRFKPREVKTLPSTTGLPDRALANRGDVLINRSSGSIDRVGAVCVVEDVLPRTYLSDLILRLHPNDEVNPEYLAEALMTDNARRQIVASARGSSTMRKISRATLKELTIPVPEDLRRQTHVAGLLRLVREVHQRARSLEESAVSLRASLAAELVSGRRSLPLSYDRFLKDAA